MRALPYLVAARTEGIESSVLRMWFARASDAVPQLTVEHRDKVKAAAFSPDGARVVTASDDNTARVWDARTGKPVTDPLEHRAWVFAAVFSPDGARVVTASYDGTVRVWDLPMDPGSLSDWQRRARCAPFALKNGVLVENHSPCP